MTGRATTKTFAARRALFAFLCVACAGLFAPAAFAQEEMTIIAGSTAVPNGTCVPAITPVPLCNAGFAGDNGPAINANLHSPFGVAVGPDESVYIADGLNGVIRKVDTSGNITTYAIVSQTTPDTTATAVTTDSSGNVYYGDSSGGVYENGSVLEPQNGTAIEALATDNNGNLYVLKSMADLTQYQLSVYVTSSHQSFLLADTSGDTAGLLGDKLFGVTAQAAGGGTVNLFVLDPVYKGGENGTPEASILEIIVNTGGASPAVTALSQFAESTNLPAVYGQTLAIDLAGNFYINEGSAVIKYIPGAATASPVAGTGASGFNNGNNPSPPFNLVTNYNLGGIPSPATATDINQAQGIFVDQNGVLYIADTANNLVRKVSNSPGCQECGPANLVLTDQLPIASFAYAENPVTQKLYVTNATAGVVNLYNTKNDTFITSYAVGNSPAQPVIDSVNNIVYVPNAGPATGTGPANFTYTVSVINENTGVVSNVTIAGAPGAIALDPTLNKAYVAISGGTSISVISGPSGSTAPSLKGNIPAILVPSALAVDTTRNIVYARCFCLGAPTGEENYSLAIIDATTDTVTNTVSEFISSSTSIATDSIAVDETSGHVAIAATGQPSMNVWVPANSGFQTYSPGFFPQHIVVDSSNEIAYITDGFGNSASVNLATFTAFSLSTAVEGGNTCSGSGNVIGVDPSTDQAYMTTCGSETGSPAAALNLIDGPTGKIIATTSLGDPAGSSNSLNGFFAIAVDPTTHVVYVANSLANQLDVFNGPAAAARPVLAFSPSPLTFAPVGVGQTAAATLTVTNSGSASTTLNPTISLTQGAGTPQIVADGCTSPLPAAVNSVPGSCTYDVTFTPLSPTQAESFAGSIVFADTALDTPQIVNFSGTVGLTTINVSPSPLAFGPVPEDVETTLDITVTNTAGAPLAVSSIAFTNSSSPDFQEFDSCGFSSIVAGSSCTIEVSYSPSTSDTVGAQETATLQITDNASGSPQSVAITGTSANPNDAFGELSPGTSLSFGNIAVNEPSATQQITLQNDGSAALGIGSIAITGANAADFQFQGTNNCGSSVALFASCSMDVYFTPSQIPTTSETAQVVIQESGSSVSSQTISLSGTSSVPLGPPASLPELVSADNSVLPIAANPGNGSDVFAGVSALSSGGQFVAFSNQAINLPGPFVALGEPANSIYLRNTCEGASSSCQQSTTPVAIGPLGSACAIPDSFPGSEFPAIDSAGRYVAFESNACQFTGLNSNNANQVFLRNLSAQTTALVSLDSTTNPVGLGVASGSLFSMSANARFFAYESTSSNVVAGVMNASVNPTNEIYWQDACTGQTSGCQPTQLISQPSGVTNALANGLAEQASISPDGRYVAFASTATNLSSNPDGNEQAYLRDTCFGATGACTPSTILISQNTNGSVAGGTNPSVSSGGRFVVFISFASGEPQIYLRDTCVSNGVSVCATPASTLLSQLNGVAGSGVSSLPFISADGRLITFTSTSILSASVPSNSQAIYEYDTCQSNGVPVTGACTSGLSAIAINPSGHFNIEGGAAVVDATDQFVAINLSSAGNSGSPVSEIYLSATTVTATVPPTLLPTVTLLDISPLGPVALSQSVTLTATVLPTSGSGTPTGTVTFFSGSTVLGSPVSLVSGIATLLNFTSLTAGAADSITATYSGDATYATSTSSAMIIDVGPPIATFSSSNITLPNAILDQTSSTVSLTLTNTGAQPLVLPLIFVTKDAGTAEVFGGGGTLNEAPFGVTGTAITCNGAPVTFEAITSPLTINPGVSCAIPLVFDPNDGDVESVSESSQTDTILFSDNAPTSNAPFQDTPPSAQSPNLQDAQTITVSGNFLYPTTANISSSAPTAAVGTPVTLTAAVTSASTGTSATPTGTVMFSDGPTTLPATSGNPNPAPLVNGMASYTTSSLPAGANSVTAVYSGDLTFGAATSSVLMETITGSGSGPSPANVPPDTEPITVTDSVTVTPLINVAAPVVFFSTNSVGFGSASGTQIITVSNIGTGSTALTLTSAAIPSGSGFTLGAIACSNGNTSFAITLPSGGACMISVTYAAPQSGTANATLTFTDNAALSNLTSTPLGSSSYTQTIALLGAGATAAAPAAPPATVDVTDNETIAVTDAPQAQPAACPAITVTPTGALAATLSVAYSQQFTATGSTATPLAWSLTGAPTWLSISSSGLVSGTPAATGTFPFTVTATDKNGCSGSASASLTVAPKPTATTTTITSTSSTDNGLALPANTALLEVPVTVNFKVQPVSGSATATGTVKVTDGVSTSDGCSVALAASASGAGSCALTISPTASATTPLTATYTPDAPAVALGLLSGASPAVTETLTEIDSCGTLPASQTVAAGSTSTFTLSVCLAGNVQAAATAVVTGCPPSAECSDTITPVTGQPGVYTVVITIVTESAGRTAPLQDRWPRGKPWPFALAIFGALLALLTALRLARQNQRRPRLAYGTGLLLALLMVLTGISGCVRGGANGNGGTPPNSYVVIVSIVANNVSINIPLHITITR
ncbi:MAG: Ig-like domain repeat protein [Candidatus Acidiferrales bacterium]